jgi:hypothetical protein
MLGCCHDRCRGHPSVITSGAQSPKMGRVQPFSVRPRGHEPPQARCLQGPQPWTAVVDASRSVGLVQIARIAGRMGRIGRDRRCQSVVKARLHAASVPSPVLVDGGAAYGGHVVIPWGGGWGLGDLLGAVGVQRSGGNRWRRCRRCVRRGARHWVRAILASPRHLIRARSVFQGAPSGTRPRGGVQRSR